MAANGLGGVVTITPKLSSQLAAPPPSAAAAAGRNGEQKAAAADLPRRANLVTHEIFGTDPLSEGLLPALRDAQLRLAAPGCRFLPRGVRVVGAVAACRGLKRLARPGRAAAAAAAAAVRAAGGEGAGICWDLSALEPLAPAKAELQAAELAAAARLLTAPAELLAFDFARQRPLPLAGARRLRLPLLARPARLDLPPAAAAKEDGGDGGMRLPWRAPGSAGSCGDGEGGDDDDDDTAVGVLYWFEADCGAGGVVTTAPGRTPAEHWAQSFEFAARGAADLEAALLAHAARAGAAVPEGGGSGGGGGGAGGQLSAAPALEVLLDAGWRYDRCAFDVAGLGSRCAGVMAAAGGGCWGAAADGGGE